MKPFPSNINRAVIEGIDGSGKSTAARGAAQQLSEQYKDTDIRVADSTGIAHFRGGELTRQTAPWLIDLEPKDNQSKLRSFGQLGLFTALRQLTEAASYRSDNLVIGVRDPYRIDPATYAGIYGISKFGNMKPEDRLRFFNKTAVAPHPSLLMHLTGETDGAFANTADRDISCPHETREAMGELALELSSVLSSYEALYNRPVVEVEALTPQTTNIIAAHIEEYLPRSRRSFPAHNHKVDAA